MLEFKNREVAAQRLALQLSERRFVDPLVLAIPRGGVLTGAVIARELPAELDVILSRKLRAPHHPELAIGAVTEEGDVSLRDYAGRTVGVTEEYLQRERRRQLRIIDERRARVRAVRPPATVANRSVIVTDDGVATGATMLAALDTLARRDPREVIVAIPVAPPEAVRELRRHCDDVLCLEAPRDFRAVGQYYEDFAAIDEDRMLAVLSRVFIDATRHREKTR